MRSRDDETDALIARHEREKATYAEDIKALEGERDEVFGKLQASEEEKAELFEHAQSLVHRWEQDSASKLEAEEALIAKDVRDLSKIFLHDFY